MKTLVPDFPMPIITPRLLIRPMSMGDGVIINPAIIESFEELHRFMAWAKERPSIDESENHARLAAENWVAKLAEEPWLSLVIIDKKTNQFIGSTGFHHYDWDVPCVEIGYWVRKSRAQEGLISEAINALTQYAFIQLGVKRIAITCDRDNIRSKKIPEKLGYVLEATLKNNRIKLETGEVTDTLVYARYDGANLPELEVSWRKQDA